MLYIYDKFYKIIKVSHEKSTHTISCSKYKLKSLQKYELSKNLVSNELKETKPILLIYLKTNYIIQNLY